LGSNKLTVTSLTGKELTSTRSAACTSACTSEAENVNAGTPDAHQGDESEGIDQGEPLAKLAAALLTLSSADRERLAAMLIAQGGNKGVSPPLP
jgi:hypothetical protein